MGVEFRLLGPLEAVVDGHPVPLGGPKQRALLALLLLHANETVPTDRALEAIWREVEPRAAARSLHVYVSSLRKVLGSAADVIQTRPGGYALAVADEHLDAVRFERLAYEGREAAHRGDAAAASSILRDALGVWRGPALADLAYEEFAQAAVANLEELRLTTLEERIDADLALGRHAELVPELEALVAEHPYRERLHRQLMLARYRSGRQADALAAYQEARRILDEQLGLEPSRELRELEAAILRQDPSLLVEPVELRARRRLPAPATPLVGRRSEIDGVTALLRGEGRFVTLTGPGGAGKTRVAIQSAHELADAFPDGVVFVGLAALRDAGLVTSEIAAVLGVADGSKPVAELLADHLRDRTALLLVDNIEQVDAAAPALAGLLGDAAGLRLLVTSRHPLRVYGEHEFPVPPLTEEEAVALFVARAQAVDRAFRPSAAVAELCLRLDRLPLAIELAAGRIRDLSADEVLGALPSRLDVAAGGPRDAPERHQTLWATIDWSYELLDPAEQDLFARLAVFSGGCDGEAAKAVCAADAELTGALVEKNLLLEADDRLGMLETVREYALQRLDGLDDAALTRRRHADHYLSLVLAGKEVRRDPRELVWMDRLDRDRENVRAAFAYLLEHDPQEAARLADGAYRFWYTRAYFEEGLRAFERVVELGDLLVPHDRANALMYCAAFAFGRRDLARAGTLVEEALQLQRRLGDPDPIARALVLLGTIRTEQGDHDAAVQVLEESVELARPLGDAVLLSFALGHLVMATVNAELYERARELGEEALALMQGLGNVDAESTVLASLGLVALRTGEFAEAAERNAAALTAVTTRDDPVGMLDQIERIAAVAAAMGEPESAARLLGAAEALENARDIQLEAVSLSLRLETVDALQDALGEAERASHWQGGRELTLDAAAAEAAQLAARLSRAS